MRIRTHRSLITAGVFAAALVAASPAAAFASDLVVYTGGAYSGASQDLNQCGPIDIPAGYNGSYVFYYTGQTLTAYNQPDAQGVAVATLNGSTSQLDGFGWQSVFIQC
jgi:MiAMP1 protein